MREFANRFAGIFFTSVTFNVTDLLCRYPIDGVPGEQG